MASINFYLDKPDKKETYVMMYVREKGKTVKIYTGLSIPPKYWDNGKQQAKQTKAYPNYSQVNLVLKTKTTQAERALLELKARGNDYRLADLKEKLNPETDKKADLTFFEVYDQFLSHAQINKGKSTYRTYITLRNHLRQFSADTGVKITFENINIGFLDRLDAYYYEHLKFLDSSRSKYITILKTFMNWATDREYNDKLDFKRFKKPKVEDKDIVYLTKGELDNLYHLDLSKKKRLANMRDVFCLGCYTGLRFSDIAKLQKDNVKDNFLLVNTYKTRAIVKVPLRSEAKVIINRHIEHPNFLPAITNQKSNLYLKELGKLAGIDEPTRNIQYRGSQRIETVKPKYEYLSTHTGRRTFVTLSLEAGARPEIVMEITGHKSYKTFKKYIKITEKVVEKEMQRIWGEGTDSNPFMKVANG